MYLTCITITQSTIVTGPIGFNIGLTNVNARLSNVVSTLYQRCVTLFRRCVTLFRHCFNVGHWRYINVVQLWKSDVGICFIFNVGSTLFQRWSTTLKQRWSDAEMLAGNVVSTLRWVCDVVSLSRCSYHLYCSCSRPQKQFLLMA